MDALNDVITLTEAAQVWNIDSSTLRHAIKNNKFTHQEVYKSGNVWLVRTNAMYSKYGDPNKEDNRNCVSLYTIGYEGLNICEFIVKLKEAGIDCIVDVREIPLSRKRGFSKSTLSEELKRNGIKYAHFKSAGSPKDVREKLKATKDYDVFFKEYREYILGQKETLQILDAAITSNTTMKFCLLCFEKDYRTCHRMVLADILANNSDTKVKIINL